MIWTGIVIGLLLAIIIMLATRRYQTPIDRMVKRVENYTKEKGEIFVEDDAQKDLEVFLENLPKEL